MNFHEHFGCVLVFLFLSFVLGQGGDFLGSNSVSNLLVRGNLLHTHIWQFCLVAEWALEAGHSAKSMDTSF